MHESKQTKSKLLRNECDVFIENLPTDIYRYEQGTLVSFFASVLF